MSYIIPFKKILNYSACVIFFIGITTYIYFMILDYMENKERDTEEQVWIYLFLFILIVGFVTSFYLVEKYELGCASGTDSTPCSALSGFGFKGKSATYKIPKKSLLTKIKKMFAV